SCHTAIAAGFPSTGLRSRSGGWTRINPSPDPRPKVGSDGGQGKSVDSLTVRNGNPAIFALFDSHTPTNPITVVVPSNHRWQIDGSADSTRGSVRWHPEASQTACAINAKSLKYH